MSHTRFNQVAVSIIGVAVLFYVAAFAGLLTDCPVLVSVAKFAFNLH